MLFDLAPKRSRRDLYNYEYELEQLRRFYFSSRVVAVLGCRRIGKTSLILTFLNEWKVPHDLSIAGGSRSPVTELTSEVL